MKNEVLHTASEVKFVGETGTFQGYASLFGVVDSVRDIVQPGAFTKSLEKSKAEGRLPPMLWAHDAKEPIGAWRKMMEDSKGLYVEGELFFDDIPRARQVYRLLKENVVNGLSIGYRTRDFERDKKGQRLLKEVELLEVSIVTFPALAEAQVSGVKSGPRTEREFEELLRDAGFSRSEAKAITASGFKQAMSQRDAGGEDLQGRMANLLAAITTATP